MSESNTPENRYARQRQFAPIGESGQRRIESSEVAVLGCGALGTVAAEILCRAGVGTLRLVDRDIIEWTNLQRQSLFIERDAREAAAKAEIAALRLAEINAETTATPEVVDVSADNIDRLLRGVDLVIDASDNFSLRFLLNDWALSTETPWVHGGCVGGAGQVRLFDGQGAPCFRCLVPEVPPADSVQTCDTAGVIGGATHAIASLQAIEAIKWLSGNRDAVNRRVLSIDFWNNRRRDVRIDESLSEACPSCRLGQYEALSASLPELDRAVTLCGRKAVQVAGHDSLRLDLNRVADRWRSLGEVQVARFFVRMTLDSARSVTLFRDGRAVISGVTEPAQARSIYDRYVGS